jgi:hypothetical protein
MGQKERIRMCIIVHKPRGIEMPSRATLEECFCFNPDGFGAMWVEGGKVKYKKGIMDYTEAVEFALQFRKDDEVAFHFRITTAGGTCKENCHPFPFVNNYDKMKELEGSQNMMVMHNGILNIQEEWGDVSDTMTFLKYLATAGVKLRNPNSVQLVEELLDGTNKLLLMQPHHTRHLGVGWIVDGGVWYSNSSYQVTRGYTQFGHL